MNKQATIMLLCVGCYMMGLLDTLDKIFTWQLLIAGVFMFIAFVITSEDNKT